MPDQQNLSTEQPQAKEMPGATILVGDIGGTKCNLALYRGEGEALRPIAVASYATASAAGLDELIDRFLAAHGRPSTPTAAFGVAGPVVGNTVRTTNIPWLIDGDALARRFGWDRVLLLNDLAAMAYAIPHLRADQLLTLNEGRPVAGGTIGLLAAGTGLGEALLVWDGSDYLPCPSEGGHKDFAARSELEFRLRCRLAERYDHVSVERVLCGQGLADIYRFLRAESQTPEPAWLTAQMAAGDAGAAVTAGALDRGDPLCRRALALFVDLYGAEAGNLALQGLTLGGLYVGGGIAPKIAPAILEGPFLASFTAKGRMRSLLESIPVRIITDQLAPLMGAAAYTRNRSGGS